jgi:DNA-binding XRE family transcriptional regulator
MSDRATEPVLSLMSAEELARAVGEHFRLARAGKAWTVEEAARAADLSAEAVAAAEAGSCSLQESLALARTYGFAHELWNATMPRAASLDELERIEMAIAERNHRRSSGDV